MQVEVQSLDEDFSWPILEGRYKVGNKQSPIAICTMSSVDLEFPMDKIAIAGKCVTENLGIEKIVKNTVSNPNIRYMIICGKVSMGHFVDNAIVSLIENGVDSEGRILGAKGGIPVVKNLTNEEIERFREQIIPINMAGETDVSKIMEKVDELFENNLGPFEGQAVISQQIEKIDASLTPIEFESDERGYFTIQVNLENKEIIVEHHELNGNITKIITGKSAAGIYHTIIKQDLISKFAHAAYIGKELEKAELALNENLEYEQDKDLILLIKRIESLEEKLNDIINRIESMDTDPYDSSKIDLNPRLKSRKDLLLNRLKFAQSEMTRGFVRIIPDSKYDISQSSSKNVRSFEKKTVSEEVIKRQVVEEKMLA